MKAVVNDSISYPDTGKFGLADYIKINIFGFAINILWTPLHALILPIMVLSVVDESVKGTYLGLITLVSMVLAIIVQPIAGAVSDRSGFSWGKRRPYILVGSIFLMALLMALGRVNSLAVLFITICLIQIASNVANGPWLGFIPDLVPDEKRGLASGVKGIMEILGAISGILIVGYLMSESFSTAEDTKLLVSLGVIVAVIACTVIYTLVTVKEKPGTPGQKIHWLSIMYQTFNIGIKANRDFIFFLASRLLFLTPLLVLRNYGYYLFIDVIDVADPAIAVTHLTIVLTVCLLIAVLPTGYIADKVGRRWIIIASGVTGVIGFIILFFFQTYFSVMLAGGFIGLANGAFMSSNWAMATDLVHEGEEARYLGLTNLATGGAALVATLAGPLLDLFNNLYTPKLGYQVVVAICVVFFVISASMVLRIRTR